MKTGKKIWLLITLVLLFTTSCEGATNTPAPTELPPTQPQPTSAPPILTDDGIYVGANLNCPDRASFGYVTENSPIRNALMDSPIHFRWYYFAVNSNAPDWANDCVPTTFTLYLAPGPDYANPTTYEITPSSVDNLVNILMFHFYLSDPLLPHTTYRWMVVGHADGIDIGQERLPLFQDESAWKLDGNQSQMDGQFQTGPACDPATIGPPVLLNPPDQSALDTNAPLFQWDMPNCSASAYLLNFDTNPQMDSVDIGWVTRQESFLMFEDRLQPCEILYWQVKAGLYSTSYHLQSGDWATESEIRSFILRSPDCPNAVAVPTATPTLPPTATFIPTATPIVCGDYQDAGSCNAHSDVCKWVPVLTHMGGGYCTEK